MAPAASLGLTIQVAEPKVPSKSARSTVCRAPAFLCQLVNPNSKFRSAARRASGASERRRKRYESTSENVPEERSCLDFCGHCTGNDSATPVGRAQAVSGAEVSYVLHMAAGRGRSMGNASTINRFQLDLAVSVWQKLREDQVRCSLQTSDSPQHQGLLLMTGFRSKSRQILHILTPTTPVR